MTINIWKGDEFGYILVCAVYIIAYGAIIRMAAKVFRALWHEFRPVH